MFGYDLYTVIPICISTVVVLFTALYWYVTRNDNYWKKRGVPFIPRRNTLELLWLFFKKPFNELLKLDMGKYGPAIGGFEGSTPIFSLSEPDLLRDVLVKDFHIFHYRRHVDVYDPLTKNLVSILEGEDWKRVRTIITPAFTSKRMRQMGSIIDDCSKSVIETCERSFKDGKPVECKGLFGTFTMDVIARAAFGTQIDSHNDPENAFLKEAKKTFMEPRILTILMALILPTWILLRLSIFHLDRNHFFQNVIETVIKERKKTGKKYNDVLQILMDAADETEQSLNSEVFEDETDRFGSIAEKNVSSTLKNKKLSKLELLAQCVLFFFAGFETTASVLTFLAYELAMNPEWQEKLIEEVDKAFEKHRMSSEEEEYRDTQKYPKCLLVETEMSYDAVRDMKVLDAVVSETLRMYPTAVITERTASEDYELGNTGIVIEKGIRVAVPIYRMHYDPDLFEDPETFNPKRFMDPSEAKHHPYAYLPFGAGPRNCLGMRFALLEIKLCVANLLRHFRFRKDSKTQIKYKMGGFLSVNDLYLAVEKRTDVK